MDIRTFFNTEYSKLQIVNNNVSKELNKTIDLIDSHIDEFEKITTILKGYSNKKSPKTETASKLVKNTKNLQKKLTTSVSKLLELKKQPVTAVPKKEISKSSQIVSKFSVSNMTIENATFKSVNFLNASKKVSKGSQSQADYYRTDDTNSLYTEKIKLLKSINSNLSNSPNFNLGEAKEEKDSGPFLGNIGGIIAALLGGGISGMLAGGLKGLLKKALPFGLGKAGRLGRLATVAKGRMGQKLGSAAGGLLKGASKVGMKALPIIGAVMSTMDLIRAIKSGYSDYKKYSAEGDKLGAQSAISSTLMYSFGNIINIVGSFLPGPLGLAVFGLGSVMNLIADEMRQTKGKTEGYVGDAREKVAKTEQLIEKEKQAGSFVELRQNIKDYKNIYWEYNDGNEWKPVVDKSTGKNLSGMRDHNPIIASTDPTKPGIQTYKITTKTGIREIVMEGGNLFMNVPNVGKVPISTRRAGGPVVRNKTYVVGEHRAETFVPNKQKNIKLEKQIEKDRVELKKQSDKRKREIDRQFEGFFDDIKTIKSFFVSSQSVARDVSSTQTGTLTSNEISKLPMGSTDIGIMKTASSGSTKVSKTFGERYSKVKSALSNASTQTGIPLDTLVKFAHVESGFRTEVKAGTSSAKGLFQFVGGTWKEMIAKYSKQYNIDPKTDVSDPSANAIMGAVYLKTNMDRLKKNNLPVSEQNLYLLHFLGPGGGVAFIKRVLKTPDALAATIFPKAARANESIFYNKDNTSKTLNAVYAWASEKMSVDTSYMNSYAVGSWQIKNDQEAFVHKGEMIVPEYYANRIRSEAKSGKITTQSNSYVEEYDIYSDSEFWINTFMPALANVVKLEYGGVT